MREPIKQWRCSVDLLLGTPNSAKTIFVVSHGDSKTWFKHWGGYVFFGVGGWGIFFLQKQKCTQEVHEKQKELQQEKQSFRFLQLEILVLPNLHRISYPMVYWLVSLN